MILALLSILADAGGALDTDSGADDALEIGGMALFIGAFIQQAFQGGWPLIVSRWKGLGLAEDWKFRFEWARDIGRGVGIAAACLVGVFLATTVTSFLVGLNDEEDPSNTSILTDNQDSPWLIGIILIVVIGAPLTEELLFRGLVLRAFEKSMGIYVALGVSTIVFTIPHYQPGATAGETAVLFVGIATIGLILGIVTVRYDRLGPAILGHFFFNLFGTISALTL